MVTAAHVVVPNKTTLAYDPGKWSPKVETTMMIGLQNSILIMG